MHGTTGQIEPLQPRHRAWSRKGAGCAVAGSAIKRATGTREKPGKAFWRGDHFLTRAACHIQAAGLQQAKATLTKFCDFIRRMAAPITIGWRIDQHEHPFRRALRGARPCFSILRANINCRCRSDVAPAEDSVEFRRVILSEKYIVMHQGKARGRRLHTPGDGRKGTRGAWRIFCCTARRLPQKALRQRCHIAVEDHSICGNFLALCQPHTRNAALARHNLRNFRTKAEVSTLGFSQALDSIRHAPHAALHKPHTILFHMRDKHQRGRRQPGRTPAIGRVTPK